MALSLDSYLRHLEVSRRLAVNSLEAYSRDLGRLAAFADKVGTNIDALTLHDLEAFVRELMTSGLSPASTARTVAAVRGYFKFLRLNGAIAANPAEDLRSPRQSAAEIPVGRMSMRSWRRLMSQTARFATAP